MKTNTERLVDALKQVDDGEFTTDGTGDEVILDGRWETEALEAAIVTHLIPLSSVIERKEAKAMFLRTAWADGTTDDGRKFEIAAAGATLILSIGPFDDTREVYTIRVQDLAPAWLRAVGAGS